MVNYRSILIILIFLFVTSHNFAQVGESPFKLFGYFQTLFAHQDIKNDISANSFTIQQMNLFVQKDLAKDWTTLVNFEFLNTYSSSRLWGAFNLEEAWVRYRVGKRLNLKVGLQTPIFNSLNEINNRTPLLPYIIRPLAYETSFEENIDIEAFVPQRTFVQAYGYIPLGNFKFDYAVYFGNSPNISNLNSETQSGIDTTNTFLLGGRTGIRFNELKAGVSVTYDKVTEFKELDTLVGLPSSTYDEMKRIRFGADLSYSFHNFSFESEIINVFYDDNSSNIDFDKTFFYGTLSYQITDNFLAYISYWHTIENEVIKGVFLPEIQTNVKVPNFGAAYDFNDRIRLKVHYGAVKIDVENYPKHSSRFKYYSAAVSVFF
jgi:Gram-negative porin